MLQALKPDTIFFRSHIEAKLLVLENPVVFRTYDQGKNCNNNTTIDCHN